MKKKREEIKRQGEEVSYRIKDHCLIVKLKSDLDHHVSVQIREQADGIIARENIKNIIFDFSESSFMDSSGIGVIMGRYKQVKFTGGKLFVTGVTPPIERILKISGLYKIIEKQATVVDALRAL